MIKTGSEVVCVLKGLLRQAPSECFTLGWLMSNLQQRSFGIVLLFLGLLATIPMGSTVPGVMLAAVALQMIAGRRELVFPRFITARRMPTRYLLRVGGHAIRVMQYIEKAFHPRWPTFFEAGKRFVGIVVLLLTAALLLTPVPLSNVPPAIVIALLSLAYLERDGLLLCFGLLAALILISVESAAIWGTIAAAVLIVA